MEKDMISIQCDEMTKSIMDELQSDMFSSLSKVSKDINGEIIEKFKSLDKKIFEINNNFEDANENIEEKIDELEEKIKEIKKLIENKEENVKSLQNEEDTQRKNEKISKIMDNTEKIQKDVENVDKNIQNNVKSSMEDILKAINDINIKQTENTISSLIKDFEKKLEDVNQEFIEEKLAVLGLKVIKDTNKNTESIISRIDESNNTDVLLAKISLLTKKLESRDKIIEEISNNQSQLNNKIDEIQKILEWKNKPLFIRSFNKKS